MTCNTCYSSASEVLSLHRFSGHLWKPQGIAYGDALVKQQTRAMPMFAEWLSQSAELGLPVHGPQPCTEAWREDNMWVMEQKALSWLLHGTFSHWMDLALTGMHVVPVKSLQRAEFDWISYSTFQEEEHVPHSHQFSLANSRMCFTGLSTNHFMVCLVTEAVLC